MEVNIEVINPYAAAEVIAQKKINWEQVAEPQAMLAEISGGAQCRYLTCATLSSDKMQHSPPMVA